MAKSKTNPLKPPSGRSGGKNTPEPGGKSWAVVLHCLSKGASLMEASVAGGYCEDFLYSLKKRHSPRWDEAQEVIDRYRSDLIPRALGTLEKNLNHEEGQVSNNAACSLLKAQNYGGFGKQAVEHTLTILPPPEDPLAGVLRGPEDV